MIEACLSDCGEWIAIDFENCKMGHGKTEEEAIQNVNKEKEPKDEIRN